MKNKIEIELKESTQSICRSLGITPEYLFHRFERDLSGHQDAEDKDSTLIFQLYVSTIISKASKIERSKVEDFLDQLLVSRKQFEVDNHSYFINKKVQQDESFCTHCKHQKLK